MRLADSPYLAEWLKNYKAGLGEIDTRRAMAIRAHGRAHEVKMKVVSRLQVCRGVTVGVDGWTNVRHDKVINLCPVGRGVAYYWSSVVLKKGASAKEQTKPIANGLKSIASAGVMVVAIVMDNEAVNAAVHRRLTKKLPILIHIPCAAHTVQLCVKKALKLPSIASCVSPPRPPPRIQAL